jgi:hypothetical protein
MKQKDAVYQAIVNVMGSVDGPVVMSKEERAQVNGILFEGFRNGTIDLDREYDDKELKEYNSGLISNWLRKDERLNGGVAYVPKNPGSRTGTTDPQVVAMRGLLETKSDPSERAEIQAFLDKRIAELKPNKVKTINVDDLPAELKAKYIAGK